MRPSTSGTERFRGLIPCSESKEGFLELLESAIEKDLIDQKKVRLEAARKHSWQERMKELFKIIDPYLGVGDSGQTAVAWTGAKKGESGVD